MAFLHHFRRPHHQRIAKLLHCFDPEFLLKAECYFGGGTAIALALDEYRESVDIDFLCSSQEGFRMIRSAVGNELGPLLLAPVKYVRGVTSNQYKIQAVLEMDETRVKVEIIREGNTTLRGEMDAYFGIPLLSRTDQWSQKLMANADRALDKSTMSRDIIDLSMMLRGWGPLPRDAFVKAHDVYGDSIERGFNNAFELISNPVYLQSVMEKMGMDLSLSESILTTLDDASARVPLGVAEQFELERRIEFLSKVEDLSGVDYFYWKEAVTHLSSTSGSSTNWAKVDRDFLIDSVVNHDIDIEDVIEAISKFSPAAASASRMKAVAKRIQHQVPSLLRMRSELKYQNLEQSR